MNVIPMPLTDRQKIFMEDIPDFMRETLLEVWHNFKERKHFNTAFERNKAEEAFYIGFQTCLKIVEINPNHSL